MPHASLTTSNIEGIEETVGQKKTVEKSFSHIAEMASITMTASFLGGATLSAARSPATTSRRLVITNSTAKASEGEGVKVSYDSEKECNNGRRDLMFAAAAATVCSVAGIAVAGDVKPGTPEAKKIYAPVCVTMPTAKICHK